MKRWIGYGLIAASCAGCATSLSTPPVVEGAATPLPTLRFQNLGLSPRNGGQLVEPHALRPGDILLSATNGITSAGIRLITLAPVSHASLYIGDGQVVEAVGKGVRQRTIAEVLGEEDVVVAFRHPHFLPAHHEKLRAFALEKVGRPYDHVGIVLQAPFALERRLCELPLIPDAVRNACLQGIAAIQLGTYDNDGFFCSQLVLESYKQAGLPITDANPRWISPADILHMREGDVPSLKIHQPLSYVGHLKFLSVTQE
ncbi:MAG: distant relative of cell wall-associated hydrolase [Burkholderiales bacterium RIFCSPLOWO2_02_FULL_57_36]|nr:MAG: distant relative of cell wall-associated hydrolase [Burkholderiales bacterium RIFCSPLOWO2_02_FULL_57_36]